MGSGLDIKPGLQNARAVITGAKPSSRSLPGKVLLVSHQHPYPCRIKNPQWNLLTYRQERRLTSPVVRAI